MKPSSAISLILLAGIAGFLLGNRTLEGSFGHDPGDSGKMNARTSSSRTAILIVEKNRADDLTAIKSGRDRFSAEKALHLTAVERVALLKKAAVLGDPAKQAEILCNLIPAMTQDELMESTKILLDVQRRGNVWSPAVWDTLWTQWGRVNAEACLALSKTGEGYPGWNGLNGLNTQNDYRCMMAGWLETHPEAALAWARQAKDNSREAAAAAFAITSSAKGDLKEMASAIASIPADHETAKACLQDYFDLAVSTGDHPPVDAVYGSLSPSLQATAWPMTLERLTYTDPQSAAAWLEKHAADPGCDFRATYRLVNNLVVADPARATEWAARLPINQGNASPGPHPAAFAVSRWRSIDPEAADAWVETQPADAPWARRPVRPPGADTAE